MSGIFKNLFNGSLHKAFIFASGVIFGYIRSSSLIKRLLDKENFYQIKDNDIFMGREDSEYNQLSKGYTSLEIYKDNSLLNIIIPNTSINEMLELESIITVPDIDLNIHITNKGPRTFITGLPYNCKALGLTSLTLNFKDYKSKTFTDEEHINLRFLIEDKKEDNNEYFD